MWLVFVGKISAVQRGIFLKFAERAKCDICDGLLSIDFWWSSHAQDWLREIFAQAPNKSFCSFINSDEIFKTFQFIYCPLWTTFGDQPPLGWITWWGLPNLASQLPFTAFSSFGAKFIYFSINHTCMWIYVMPYCEDKLLQEYWSVVFT